MDTQKAQLESTIRARRARLDRRLHRLEDRIESDKETGKQVGVVTAAIVVAMAVIGTIAIITRQIIVARRGFR
jgi:hypothetical protein